MYAWNSDFYVGLWWVQVYYHSLTALSEMVPAFPGLFPERGKEANVLTALTIFIHLPPARLTYLPIPV